MIFVLLETIGKINHLQASTYRAHLNKVMYNSRKHDYSSSALRRRVAEGEKIEKKKKSQG